MDPYKILGIPATATDDEVKKAYKQLAKKYHPDMNVGASNIKELEQKFKQVQEAYNLIMDAREKGYDPRQPHNQNSAGSGGNYDPFGGSDPFDPFRWFNESFGGGYSYQRKQYQGPLEYQAAERYLEAGHFFEARNVLSSIPESSRNARWYYLSALANAGLGNNTQARQQAETACRMDAENDEYRYLYEQLSGSARQYNQRGGGYGGFGGYGNFGGGNGCPIGGGLGDCCGCIAFNVLLNLLCCRC